MRNKDDLNNLPSGLVWIALKSLFFSASGGTVEKLDGALRRLNTVEFGKNLMG